MRISYIILILSFILDTIVLNNINFTINTIYVFPMFTLAGLICSYFYSITDEKYLILCGICGFLIDINWTNTIIIYTIIYIFLGFIIIFFNKLFAINIFNYLVEVIILICIENIIIYFILSIINVIELDWYILLLKILKSIPITLIFAITLYNLFSFIGKKYKIKKRY